MRRGMTGAHCTVSSRMLNNLREDETVELTMEEFSALRDQIVALIPSATFEEDSVDQSVVIRTDVFVLPRQSAS